MVMFKRVAVLCSASILTLMSQVSFADQAQHLACPTIEQIQKFSPVASFPYAFNPAQQTIKAVAVAANMDELDDDAAAETWAVVIHPVDVTLSGTPAEATQTVLDGLIPASTEPFNYTVVDDVDVPVCAYKLPNRPKMSILAYYINTEIGDMDDDMDDDFVKLNVKADSKHKRMLAIAKRAKQFVR